MWGRTHSFVHAAQVHRAAAAGSASQTQSPQGMAFISPGRKSEVRPTKEKRVRFSERHQLANSPGPPTFFQIQIVVPALCGVAESPEPKAAITRSPSLSESAPAERTAS